MTIAALIVAAGRGARMGTPRPKVLLRVGGETILARAVLAFLDHPRIDRVIVAVADEAAARAALGASAGRVLLIPGGRERQDSVEHALDAAAGAGLVLVHDAARPLVEARLIDAVIEAAARHGAAIPALRVAATVKRVADDGYVAATVPREDLILAQTPQGFHRDLLLRAYARARRDGYRGTDDASLVEHDGGRVMVVDGSPRNIKITGPPDLELAEALLRGGGPAGPGAGVGGDG